MRETLVKPQINTDEHRWEERKSWTENLAEISRAVLKRRRSDCTQHSKPAG